MADTAIKTGKENINCGKDFFEWGSKTGGKIKYEFVEKTEYEEANKQVEARQKQINPVKGTMKLHSVSCISEDEIMVRDVTCVCEKCFTKDGFMWTDTSTCGWRKHSFKNTKASEKSSQDCLPATEIEPKSTENEKAKSSEHLLEINKYATGEFIAALYKMRYILGK